MRFYLLVLAVMAAGIGVNTAMAQQPSANDHLRHFAADIAPHPAQETLVSPA
ncbi:MAG: hypothetical protein KAH44_01380 [Oricola sp.]|nr:hypothetical protein [Oricola sp.]